MKVIVSYLLWAKAYIFRINNSFLMIKLKSIMYSFPTKENLISLVVGKTLTERQKTIQPYIIGKNIYNMLRARGEVASII